MDAIGGLSTTRRRVQGPGLELVGLGDARSRHTALWFPASSPLAGAGLRLPDGARAFLERPGVVGIARLVAVDRAASGLVYATGEVWSLSEVMASLRRHGRIPGLRAGVELAWATAQILLAADQEGGPLGLHGHGAIDPWRLALRKDGQVIVVGHGMAPGALGLRLEGEQLAEALRYAPPERLRGERETPSSDLFSLTLVALEWALGEPIYFGQPEALRRQASEAEGDRRLYGLRDQLPAEVIDVMGRAIRPDRDARWPLAEDYVGALRVLLGSPHMEGPSLRQLMELRELDPPDRFVGLDEERGSVDHAPPRGEEPVPTPGEQPPEERRARWVSLGGRKGRRHLDHAPSRSESADAPVRRRTRTDEYDVAELPGTAVSPAVEAVEIVEIVEGAEVIAAIEDPEMAEETLMVPVVSPPEPVAPAVVVEDPPAAEAVAAPATPPPEPPAAMAELPETAPPEPVRPRKRRTIASVDEATAPHERSLSPSTPVPMPASYEESVRATQIPTEEWVEEEDDEDTAREQPALRELEEAVPEVGGFGSPRPLKGVTPPVAVDPVEESTWIQEEQPTGVVRRSNDSVRLTVIDPHGERTMHVFAGVMTVAEASRAVARSKYLPGCDLTGNLECAWVLGRAGEPINDALELQDIELSGQLDLLRLPNRLCRVRVLVDDGSGLRLDTVVGTAVPASELLARLMETCGLEGMGWYLRVGGVDLPDDAVLGRRVSAGSVLELHR